MNFFHNQLMKTEAQTRLFTVGQSKYKNFENHKAAIFGNVYDLIEDAIKEGENPKALIEDFLEIPYSAGDTIDEMVNFLCETHFMVHAFGILKENWDQLDESAPNDSLIYSAFSEVDEQKALAIYLERTLRDYLETLSQIYHG